MEICFGSAKLEKALGSETRRVQAWGNVAARALYLRMLQLHDAPSLETMRSLPGRCHELKGDREGQLAVDASGGLRLIFRPTQSPPPTKPDGGLDWAAVTAITILEVADYHG